MIFFLLSWLLTVLSALAPDQCSSPKAVALPSHVRDCNIMACPILVNMKSKIPQWKVEQTNQSRPQLYVLQSLPGNTHWCTIIVRVICAPITPTCAGFSQPYPPDGLQQPPLEEPAAFAGVPQTSVSRSHLGVVDRIYDAKEIPLDRVQVSHIPSDIHYCD